MYKGSLLLMSVFGSLRLLKLKAEGKTIKKRTTKYKTQIKIKYVFANHGLTGLEQQRSTKMGHLI